MIGDEKEERWIKAMRAKGHTPILQDGTLDRFVYEGGIHNGPGCSTCGWSTCWHCGDVDVIPKCAVRK